jgi:PIN domain nuclease of toxin-antitoxin system
MRLLLDSHILYWSMFEPGRLSARSLAMVADRNNFDCIVSSVTIAELHIKKRLDKLHLPSEFDEEVQALGFDFLDFRPKHARWLSEMPLHHRDPFDRMLIAQAIEEKLTILSADSKFHAYDVPLLLNT